MNQNQIKGAQERIRYHTHEMLALFTAFLLLVGWLGRRIDAGEYGIVFGIGLALAMLIPGILAHSRRLVLRNIKQVEDAPHA